MSSINNKGKSKSKDKTTKEIAQMMGVGLNSSSDKKAPDSTSNKKDNDIYMRDDTEQKNDDESAIKSNEKDSNTNTENKSFTKKDCEEELDLDDDSNDKFTQKNNKRVITDSQKLNLKKKGATKRKHAESEDNESSKAKSDDYKPVKARGFPSESSTSSANKDGSLGSRQVWIFNQIGKADVNQDGMLKNLYNRKLDKNTCYRLGFYEYQCEDGTFHTLIIFRFTSSGKIAENWLNKEQDKVVTKPSGNTTYELDVRCGNFNRTENEVLKRRWEKYGPLISDAEQNADKDKRDKYELKQFKDLLKNVDVDDPRDAIPKESVNKKNKGDHNKIIKEKDEDDELDSDNKSSNKKRGKSKLKNKKSSNSRNKSRTKKESEDSNDEEDKDVAKNKKGGMNLRSGRNKK